MLKLKVIIGSTRPLRAADRSHPGFWTARERSEFEVELLDLRDWPLPFFQVHPRTPGDTNDPTSSEPIVKRWNQAVLSQGLAVGGASPES